MFVTTLPKAQSKRNMKWKIFLISHINREERTVTHVAQRRHTDDDSQQSPSASAHWFEHQENLQKRKKTKVQRQTKHMSLIVLKSLRAYLLAQQVLVYRAFSSDIKSPLHIWKTQSLRTLDETLRSNPGDPCGSAWNFSWDQLWKIR